MRTSPLNPRLHAVAALALVLAIMAGCRPKPPETPPAPVPPAPEIASTASTLPVMGETAVDAPSGAGPTSTPAPRPARQESPRLEDMRLASSSSKLGVPVDLRYQFETPVEAGRPVTLHLAAVPRVGGSNLTVSIKETAGIDAIAAPLTAQKATAKQAYRQQLSVTRHQQAPTELRVLVTMEGPEGSTFGYFGVPLDGANAAAR